MIPNPICLPGVLTFELKSRLRLLMSWLLNGSVLDLMLGTNLNNNRNINKAPDGTAFTQRRRDSSLARGDHISTATSALEYPEQCRGRLIANCPNLDQGLCTCTEQIVDCWGERHQVSEGPSFRRMGTNRRRNSQSETGQTPQHHRRSDSGRGIPRIRIHNICLRALESDNRAGREDDRTDVGNYPMHVATGAPSVDEQADGDQNGSRDHQGYAEFGFAFIVVPHFQLAINAVVDGGADLGAEEET